jgi:cytoskeletal protein RodZ
MPDSDDRISALYQASRQQIDPPRELDQRILAEAHRAVSRRQMLPYRSLALAATVVLGVGLAWLQLHAPQTGDDPAVPMREAELQPGNRQTDGVPAMLRREAPAASAMAPPEQPSAPVMAAPPPAAPASTMLRQASPPRAKAQTLDEAASAARDAGKAVTADAEHTVADADGPCGLKTMPADEAAWRSAIREAETRGDSAAAACLQQAFRQAADERDR